ncbi:MAG TPA: hypothetical protein VGE61_02925 [Glycomyces sp.]
MSSFDQAPVTVLVMLGPDSLPHGHTVTGDLLWTLGWTAALAILFVPLATRAYKRA